MGKLTVFTAKSIRTMDAGRPTADAVAFKDGRIVSVGTLASMRPWLDLQPHDIDDRFRDKVIFPGFIDPHTHFRMSGVFMGLTYIGPIECNGSRGWQKALHPVEAVA
jgi:predicted amidohydrolase YtcJ